MSSIAGGVLWLADKRNPFIQLEMGGPDGSTFRMHKLQSLPPDAIEREIQLLQDQPLTTMKKDGIHTMATPLGGIARKIRIDELRQFINIREGSMCLVGWRPHILYQWKKFFEPKFHTHEPYIAYYRFLKKGMQFGATGLTQVLAHAQDDYDTQSALDILLAEKLSYTSHIRLVMETIKVGLRVNGR